MANSFSVNVRIENLHEILRKYRNLPKDANNRLRDKAKAIATAVAIKGRVAAMVEGSQAALVAPTVKAMRDRVPVVQAGGTRKVGSRRKPVYKVLFGSEFGSNHYHQFKPHAGRNGYWFFPLIEREQPMISKLFNLAADEAVREWARGG